MQNHAVMSSSCCSQTWTDAMLPWCKEIVARARRLIINAKEGDCCHPWWRVHELRPEIVLFGAIKSICIVNHSASPHEAQSNMSWDQIFINHSDELSFQDDCGSLLIHVRRMFVCCYGQNLSVGERSTVDLSKASFHILSCSTVYFSRCSEFVTSSQELKKCLRRDLAISPKALTDFDTKVHVMQYEKNFRRAADFV